MAEFLNWGQALDYTIKYKDEIISLATEQLMEDVT